MKLDTQQFKHPRPQQLVQLAHAHHKIKGAVQSTSGLIVKD